VGEEGGDDGGEYRRGGGIKRIGKMVGWSWSI
jgi:hypothetical protein